MVHGILPELPFRYGIYDALVIAAAIEAGCATLYSEGFHDGQTINGQVTIRNPFVGSSS
jgi:predicted nucleic acid-binding protein